MVIAVESISMLSPLSSKSQSAPTYKRDAVDFKAICKFV